MSSSCAFKILIADDYPAIRERLSSLIRDAYNAVIIEEAANTDELIQKALASEWDLVISDISMPGEGGITALRRIKKLKPSLPVLVMSTHSYNEYAKETLSAGAYDYISKDDIPYRLNGLIRQIFSEDLSLPA